ncbi:OmpA family protein [Xylanibacter muris]|uniref:OmpA family protein n=1 Tax=Xylanibacter muris TaxID=2736290 RepID=A0ABX2AL59_9BACT|nr:OmpA family protein [Xylanibacter muris]NPD91928.1 OmpA family protein [Xylanibacter muris]
MKKNLLLLLLAVICTLKVSAQENGKDYEPYPYTFIGLQGGGQVTFTNNSFSNLVTPIGAVSVGRFFTPEIGARINVQGYKNKAGYKVGGEDLTFDFKYISTDIDFLFNLSNIFSPKRVHALNVMLVGGFGFNYAWDDKGYNNLANSMQLTEPTTWTDERIVHNLRVGLQFEMNVSKHVGINLEVAANNTDDRFNVKRNNSDDWQATALLGVTYKFGFHKKRQSGTGSALANLDYDNARNASSAVATAPVVEGEKKAKEEPKPVVKEEAPKAKESTRIDIFFEINSSEVSANEKGKVKKLAEWLKQHPTAKVNLTAYADKGTGTPEINRAISQKRVVSVGKMLVKEYGIDPKRLTSEYKGDTEQPFKENDNNRVTIGIATEQ